MGYDVISAERPDFPDVDLDISSHKRDIAFRKVQEYYQSFGGEVVRVGTFKTESSKSAIQTACRGIGVSSDIGTYLSSLIPITRGSVHSLKDTYYGNPDKDLKPVTEFVNQVNQYEGLLELAIGIEDIISGRGVHPCGVCCFTDINKHTAIMKAPNGELITQYDLGDNEYTGSIKMDFLNTKTMSMLQIASELLIEAGHMEWQGTLRETYNQYLHPDVRDYDNPHYYEALNKGELISAFQFDSQVGSVALSSIRPTSLLEVANANSLMRLMSDHEEQPMDKYIRYKNDINEWYRDMEDYGLTPDEIMLVRKHLDKDNGVCSSQEGMMLLTMDEKVANFDVVQSNKLRKGCAKKVPKLIQQAKEMVFEQGIANGASDKLLHYIWDEQISMQLGYSFSILHTIGYSHILLQQLELITNYPPIYWNTAVLLLESGAITQDTESEEDNKKEKTTNYGVVASAISDLQFHGVTIDLPHINKAEVGFTPHEESNSIMFGFKGVSTINNDVAATIIANRPYASLQDFHERMVEVKREVALSTGKKQMKSLVSSTQTINLIKAGAFDDLEQRPRAEILEGYLRLLNPPKKAMTTANINAVMEMGIIPSEYQPMLSMFNFKKYIQTLPKYQDESSKSIVWHVINCGDHEMTEYSNNFFFNNFGELQEGRDYFYDEEGYVNVALKTTRKGSFEDVLKQKTKPFTQWLNSPACIDTYNYIVFEDIKRNLMDGNQSRWEMESMNYYYSEHELAGIDKERYGIVNFNELPEEPVITGFSQWRGQEIPRFELSRICGTVLDRDKNKHTVSLLTEYGVVTLKFHSGQFSFYDKTLSMNDAVTGKKVTVEESWFKRGNKLLVTGFRRGNQFRPKRYSNSIYQHALCKITQLHEDGTVSYQDERAQI